MTTPMYDSVRPFFLTADSNLSANTADQERIQSYNAYEDIYWNRPETYKLVQRGEDDQPIYLPSARRIIEATNRFLAVGWDYTVGKKRGTGEEQTTTAEFLRNLFKREKMYTKFASQRRYCLIRGDAVWHIIADITKPFGRRLTIQEVQPHHYFPIKDKMEPDKIVGVHLCNLVEDPRDKTKQVARRQTYRRYQNPDGTYRVTSELTFWEIGKWDDRYLEPNELSKQNVGAGWERPEFELEGVQALPVYHIPNYYLGENKFGCSEIRGIESVMGAINQSISDEQLTLVMQGLGVYATTGGPAVDAAGNESEYEIGPARVLELPQDGKFERISGVSSVAPMIDHMNYMMDNSSLGVGVPDIAAGKVDVTIAESGIALRLQLAPILAKNSEKEDQMMGTYDQMIYDICQYWLPKYEAFSDAMEVDVEFKVDDPMPVNREQEIAEILQLVTPPSPGVPALITLEMAVERLQKLGIEYPASAIADLRADADKAARLSNPDPQASRLDDELGDQNDEDTAA
jgi:hypothetical protein